MGRPRRQSVNTTVTLLVSHNHLRDVVTFQNQDDTTTLLIGKEGVSTSGSHGGFEVGPGQILEFEQSDPRSRENWWGIVDSGSVNVLIEEWFR